MAALAGGRCGRSMASSDAGHLCNVPMAVAGGARIIHTTIGVKQG